MVPPRSLSSTPRSLSRGLDPVPLAWGGDLDIASAPVLASALQVLVELQVPAVLLDVSAVAFMDCAGLGVLLEAHARLDHGLTLVGPSPAVRRLLQLAGVERRLPVADTTERPRRAPDTVADVEQSKGLIMAGFRCTADQAGKILLSTALRHNVQVQVLSSALVTVASLDLGHLPGGAAHAVRRVVGGADGVPDARSPGPEHLAPRMG